MIRCLFAGIGCTSWKFQVRLVLVATVIRSKAISLRQCRLASNMKARYALVEIGQTAVAREGVAGQHVGASPQMGEPSTARKSRGSEFADPLFSQGGSAERLATRKYAQDFLE